MLEIIQYKLWPNVSRMSEAGLGLCSGGAGGKR